MSYLPVTYNMARGEVDAAGCTWSEVDSQVFIEDRDGLLICGVNKDTPGEVTFTGRIFTPEYVELAATLFDYAMTAVKHRVDDDRSNWAMIDSNAQPSEVYLAVNDSSSFVAPMVDPADEVEAGYRTAMCRSEAVDAVWGLGINLNLFTPQTLYKSKKRF